MGHFHNGSCHYHHSGALGDSKCRKTAYWLCLEYGSHFSILLSNPGPLLHKSTTFLFLASRLQNFLTPFWVVTGNPFSSLNAFLIIPGSSTPLWERNTLWEVGASIYKLKVYICLQWTRFKDAFISAFHWLRPWYYYIHLFIFILYIWVITYSICLSLDYFT